MFNISDILRGNFSFMPQTTSLEEKLIDVNYPLEDVLKDDEAITCVKLMGKNTKKYFNSDKIKKLIKLITEEPEGEDQLRGHKFPYAACEILKCDCPFILKRFVLNEQEYDEEYPDNNSDDDKEIDFDFSKNDSDNSKIEEHIKNLKKKKEEVNDEENEKKDNDIKEDQNNDDNGNVNDDII